MDMRICPNCKQVFFAENEYEYSICPDCHQEQIDNIIAFFAEMNVGGGKNNYDD